MTAKKEDAAMAMGAVDDSEDYPICSNADEKAFTFFDITINDGTGEYAFCVGQGGDSQQG